jgi:hypothetical protein
MQKPLATWFRAPATQMMCILLPELPAPLAHRFIGHNHTADEQEFLNLTIAETAPVLQPHAVAHAFGRNAVVRVAIDRWWAQATSLAAQTGAGQATPSVEKARLHADYLDNAVRSQETRCSRCHC